MATGFVYSARERLRRMDEMTRLLNDARSSLEEALIFETEALSLPSGALSLASEMGSIYQGAAQITKITFLNLLTEFNINVALAQGIFTANSLGPNLTAFNIDADDGASGATITRVGTLDPNFGGSFAAGDQLTLTNCEDSANNGTFTLGAVAATILTLDAPISGGVDNPDDKTVVITLIKKA